MNPKNLFAWRDFIHTIAVTSCLHCEKVLIENEQTYCLCCEQQIKMDRISNTDLDQFNTRTMGALSQVTLWSCYSFYKEGPLQNLIHQIKYHSNFNLLKYLDFTIGLTSNLYRTLSKNIVLVPVPMSAQKRRQRGYNQTEIIADYIASLWNCEVALVLKRTHNLESQTTKGRIKRWETIRAQFEITNTEALVNRDVVLIDDVVTTGATMNACLELLLAEKCNSIQAFSIAVVE